MEPIPSKPHASRNLAISLFVLVAIVLGGVYWYRYEHAKTYMPVDSAQDLSDEQKAQLSSELNMKQPPEYSEAEKAAITKAAAKEETTSQQSTLTEEEKMELFNKLNSR